MFNDLTRYPLDPTGIDNNNLVVGEPHTLTANPIRTIAPIYGAFFTGSVEITDTVTGQLLINTVDYSCVELLQTPSEMYGKEICYIILIINPMIHDTVVLNYQVLGGLYCNSGISVANLYETITKDARPINWIDVLNKPSLFPPSPHLHDGKDLYGFEYLVSALERIRNAIVVSDVPAYESVIDWLTAELNIIKSHMPTVIDVATPTEALAGTLNDKLMTPLLVKEVIGLTVGRRARDYFLAQI